jgi:hypothetical protein
MNKSCLSCLGIIFLVIVVLGAAMFGYVAYNGSRLDASSKQYVDETLPIIVAHWDKEELLKRASPEFKTVATSEDTDALFAQLQSKLGALVKYDGAKGGSNMSYTTQYGKVISANYKADAEFERGKAEIEFKLIQHDGEWQVLGFHVNLPLPM